jgi:dTDP-4-dehydrorhamnose reductase
MNLLITGASGLLGSEIFNMLADWGHRGSRLDRIAFIRAGAAERSLMLKGFDVVIHAAANTNVERCELAPEESYFDNCFLSEQLFRHAQQNCVKFVFISSTGVYGRGKSTPYHEYDPVFPTTVHHRSKLLTEQAVLTCVDTLVVRTGWLFGGSTENPKNFVWNRLKEILNAGSSISANCGQIGSPTYVRDCARTVLELVADDCAGIYNVVNDGSASRFEYVKQIAALSGSPIEVRPVDASGFKRHADVSENEAAISYRMRFERRPPLRSWQEALAGYMRDFKLLP